MKYSEPGHIIHYYFNRLCKYAEQMKHGFSEETIHLFRVDVKKLRAYLRMMRPGSEEPERLKFSRRFKKMYSLTGKIRDRQLCLNRIRALDKTIHRGLQNKIDHLEKEIKKLSEKEDELLNKKELMEIEEKIMKHVPVVLEQTLIQAFFQQHLNVIDEVLSKRDFTDKALHSIRKSIKDIIYITRMFRDDLKTPLPFLFWNEDELKKAENLSHKLGLFNDACIALSFLLPADIKKTDTEEREHLQSVRRKWLHEKQRLKKEILDEIPAIKLNMLSLGKECQVL